VSWFAFLWYLGTDLSFRITTVLTKLAASKITLEKVDTFYVIVLRFANLALQ